MITGTFSSLYVLRIKISVSSAATVVVVVVKAVDVIEVDLVEVVVVGKVIAVVVVVVDEVVNGVVDSRVVVVEITGLAVFSEMYNPIKVKPKVPRQTIISSNIQLALT